MVTEESSVVAAASKSAGFWYNRGGFHTEIIGTRKYGHVHFTSKAPFEKVKTFYSCNRFLFKCGRIYK